MSEELQSEEVELDNGEYVEEVEQDEIAEDDSESESPSDLATDSDAEHEEKTENQINQEKVQEVINKKHWEAKEAQRKLEAAEARLKEFESRQQQAAPEVPAIPDPFDDDYEAKLKQRDDAMRQRIEWESKQRYSQESQQRQQQAEQEKQAKEVYDLQVKYTDKAKAYGIDQAELQDIGSKISQYGLRDDITIELLRDSEGPLYARYLAANPMEMEAINGMSQYQAARYIESIRPKLAALKPRKTNAPAPGTKIVGKGTDPESKKYRNLGNAKFE